MNGMILVHCHLYQRWEGLENTSVLREGPSCARAQQDSNLVGLEVCIEQPHGSPDSFEAVHYGVAVW